VTAAETPAPTLQRGEVTPEQLAQAKSPKGAAVPDGTKHDWHCYPLNLERRRRIPQHVAFLFSAWLWLTGN